MSFSFDSPFCHAFAQHDPNAASDFVRSYNLYRSFDPRIGNFAECMRAMRSCFSDRTRSLYPREVEDVLETQLLSLLQAVARVRNLELICSLGSTAVRSAETTLATEDVRHKRARLSGSFN